VLHGWKNEFFKRSGKIMFFLLLEKKQKYEGKFYDLIKLKNNSF